MYCIIYISDYVCQLYKCKISTKETRSLHIKLYSPETNQKASENRLIATNGTFQLNVNPWQLQICLMDMAVCPEYRQMIIRQIRAHNKCVLLKIDPPTHELIDFAWYLTQRLQKLVVAIA